MRKHMEEELMEQLRRSRSPPTTAVPSPQQCVKRRKFSPVDHGGEHLRNNSSFENSTSPATSSVSTVSGEVQSRSSDLKVEALREDRISTYDCRRKLSRAPDRSRSWRKTAESPSAAEIEEFFTANEKYNQLKAFTEKYNYDAVNDVPLEGGRYQWILLNP